MLSGPTPRASFQSDGGHFNGGFFPRHRSDVPMIIDWQPLGDILHCNRRFVLSSHVRPDADAIDSEWGWLPSWSRWGRKSASSIRRRFHKR